MLTFNTIAHNLITSRFPMNDMLKNVKLTILIVHKHINKLFNNIYEY